MALEQYQNAFFEKALLSLADDDSFYGHILRARALVRLGRNAEAIGVVHSIASSVDTLDLNQRLELEIVSIFPATVARDFDLARTSIRRAKGSLSSEHSIDLETEFHYIEAFYFFALDDYDNAKKAAERSLSAADDFFSTGSRPQMSACFKEHNRAKSLQLLALICSNQGRYHEQAYLIRTALKGLAKARTPDAYTLALLKLNLGYYVRDLDSTHDIELLELDSWPSELDWLSAEIARSLALYNAAQGRFDEYDGWLMKAEHFNRSPDFAILLIADRSHIARTAFNRIRSTELDAAFIAAKEIEWSSSRRYGYALYLLAQEVSYLDPRKARQLVDMFGEIDASNDLSQLYDRRDHAELRFALGTVQRNSNNEANELFFEAFDTWNSVGYRKYAAMAAIELAELTKRESFAAYARREAALRPGSWLDLRVRRMKA